MCVSTCLSTTAYLFLVLALLACALSYAAPFWILFPQTVSWATLSNVGSVTKLNTIYRTDSVGNSGLGSFFESKNWQPYWVAGLWAGCWRDDGSNVGCNWFWENGFYAEKNIPDWHKATQGLCGGGVILLFIAFILASFNLCCRCCKQSLSIGSVIGSFTATAVICIGVGIGLYGGFMNRDYSVNFEKDSVMFYWAFFVGIAGAALGLVSAILFFCDGCRHNPHSGYHMTRVV